MFGMLNICMLNIGMLNVGYALGMLNICMLNIGMLNIGVLNVGYAHNSFTTPRLSVIPSPRHV